MDMRWSNDGVTMEYLWRKGEETTRDLPLCERRILRKKIIQKREEETEKKVWIASYCFFSFKTLDYSDFFTNFAGKFQRKKTGTKKTNNKKTGITTLHTKSKERHRSYARQ